MNADAAPPSKHSVGWIGLGRIGLPMAQRVLAAGWPLQVWARRPEAAAAVLAAGATWAHTPEQLARSCSALCTVVGGPSDVQTLHDQLMPAARPGTLFIDCSTAAVHTAQAGQQRPALHGMHSVDAPVTGGVAGAEQGTLTCFVGGTEDALQRAAPLLQAFCKRIVHCGPAGSGYRTKLVNQTLMAGTLLGLADGAQLARASGMAAQPLLDALASGTGASFLLPNYLPRMMSGSGPTTFTLGLLRKDLRLALDEAQQLGLQPRLLQAAWQAVDDACQRHGSEAGVQMLAQG